jgi:hypothetical protein
MSALQELEASVRSAGWGAVDARDMNEAAERWVPGAERFRAGRLLGPFDEHAALFSLHQHYGFVTASTIGSAALLQRALAGGGGVSGDVAIPFVGGDLAIRVLGVDFDDAKTVAACRALVVSSHEALAADFPAVKRFWKNVSPCSV